MKVVTAQATTSQTRVRAQLWPREPPANLLRLLTHPTPAGYSTTFKAEVRYQTYLSLQSFTCINDVLPSHLGSRLIIDLLFKFELRRVRYYCYYIFHFHSLHTLGLIAGDKEALFLTLSVLFYGQQHHRSTPCNRQVSNMK